LLEKLTSKEKLALHLEQKIKEIVVTNEHAAVQLKSEIAMLQSRLDKVDEEYKTKLASMKLNIENDAKANVAAHVTQLEQTIKSLTQ
jgi:acetyl-CoA carboxylase alpha subunit